MALRFREGEHEQQPAHLRGRERNQGTGILLSPPTVFAAARATSRKAWASRQSVTSRCHTSWAATLTLVQADLARGPLETLLDAPPRAGDPLHLRD